MKRAERLQRRRRAKSKKAKAEKQERTSANGRLKNERKTNDGSKKQ